MPIKQRLVRSNKLCKMYVIESHGRCASTWKGTQCNFCVAIQIWRRQAFGKDNLMSTRAVVMWMKTLRAQFFGDTSFWWLNTNIYNHLSCYKIDSRNVVSMRLVYKWDLGQLNTVHSCNSKYLLFSKLFGLKQLQFFCSFFVRIITSSSFIFLFSEFSIVTCFVKVPLSTGTVRYQIKNRIIVILLYSIGDKKLKRVNMR